MQFCKEAGQAARGIAEQIAERKASADDDAQQPVCDVKPVTKAPELQVFHTTCKQQKPRREQPSRTGLFRRYRAKERIEQHDDQYISE